MKLWSIQTKEAFEVLQSTGVLRACPDFIDPWHLSAYNWLACQMKEIIGSPPRDVRYPIWAWHTVDWMQKKPDLRKSLFNAQPEGSVCLELEIDNSRVLLSDFENWHFVLNDWYYSEAHNKKEFDEAECYFESLPSEQQKTVKEVSWKKIFDIQPFENGWIRKGMLVQATFWELRLSDVTAVRIMRGRRAKTKRED